MSRKVRTAIVGLGIEQRDLPLAGEPGAAPRDSKSLFQFPLAAGGLEMEDDFRIAEVNGRDHFFLYFAPGFGAEEKGAVSGLHESAFARFIPAADQVSAGLECHGQVLVDAVVPHSDGQQTHGGRWTVMTGAKNGGRQSAAGRWRLQAMAACNSRRASRAMAASSVSPWIFATSWVATLEMSGSSVRRVRAATSSSDGAMVTR